MSRQGARAWSLTRAAAYGSGIGALAALFKIFGLHQSCSAGAPLWEIAGAARHGRAQFSGAAVDLSVRRQCAPLMASGGLIFRRTFLHHPPRLSARYAVAQIFRHFSSDFLHPPLA